MALFHVCEITKMYVSSSVAASFFRLDCGVLYCVRSAFFPFSGCGVGACIVEEQDQSKNMLEGYQRSVARQVHIRYIALRSRPPAQPLFRLVTDTRPGVTSTPRSAGYPVTQIVLEA